jgi:type VII secretion ATPase EccA
MPPSPFLRHRVDRAWTHAVDLLHRGEKEAAANAFESVLTLDPTAADAWLGLHAAERRQEEAVQSMTLHRERFGELRTRNNRKLESRFFIGDYVTLTLETPRQLWLAHVAWMLSERQIDEVGERLREFEPDSDETRFICARWAVFAEEWTLVLRFARGISDPFLHEEAQLYVAMALVIQQVPEEALNVLKGFPVKFERGTDADGMFAFWRGLATEAAGRPEEATKLYQYAFRLLPEVDAIAQKAKAQVTRPDTGEKQPSDGTSGAEKDAAALLAEGRAELAAMIGLDPVKSQVGKFEAQLRMASLRAAKEGGKSKVPPRHLVFTGPPGTGKTTVARIVGKLMAGLGLLESGHLVEAHRVDLVGEYLGHSAAKTNKKIDEALDGVLFIDEAYALQNEGYAGGDAFGSEALQTLLKRAEDDRSRLIIILAGYTDEIDRLLRANPGLWSRFPTRIAFPSYSAEELLAIAEVLVENSGDELTESGAASLATCLHTVVDSGSIDEYGNGRFVRELCGEAMAHRDLRLAIAYPDTAPPAAELRLIEAADVEEAYRQLARRG